VYLSPKTEQEEALALCSLWRIEKEVCNIINVLLSLKGVPSLKVVP